MLAPNPTFSDKGDVCSIALAVDDGDVNIGVGLEVDAVVKDTVAALFRLVFDMATVFDVIDEGLDVNVFGRKELIVDVTSMVVRTLVLPKCAGPLYSRNYQRRGSNTSRLRYWHASELFFRRRCHRNGGQYGLLIACKKAPSSVPSF